MSQDIQAKTDLPKISKGYKDYLKFDRNEVHWTTGMVALYTNLGYYTFSKPLKWNFTTGKMELVTARWHRITRICCTSLTSLSTLSLMLTLAWNFHKGKLQLNNFVNLVRIFVMLLMAIATFLQINTALKAFEIKEFTNLAMGYLAVMRKDRILKNPGGFDKICSFVLLVFLVIIWSLAPTAIVAYFWKCELHPLSTVLPVCMEEVTDSGRVILVHKSIGSIWLYSLALFYLVIQGSAGCTCYLTLVVVPVMGCSMVLDVMEESNGKSRLARNTTIWIRHYRSLQMLFRMINLSIGDYAVPGGILIAMILAVVANYAVIVLEFRPIFVPPVVVYAMFVYLFVVFIGEGIRFTERSKNVVLLRMDRLAHLNLKSKRKELGLLLKTCLPLRINVGGFFYMTRTTLLDIAAAIFDYTVNLLLSS